MLALLYDSLFWNPRGSGAIRTAESLVRLGLARRLRFGYCITAAGKKIIRRAEARRAALLEESLRKGRK